MGMDASLPLEGLYRYLLRHGFPLSVRDFEDALLALRSGHGLHRRDRLQWLCETLWVRNEDQRALLARLFREFPMPSPEDVALFVPQGPARPPALPADDSTESAGQDMQVPTVMEFNGPQSSRGTGLPRAVVSAAALQPFIFTPRPAIALRRLIVAWRRFRVAQRGGPKVELDIQASVAEQSRNGLLLEPVMVPARRNRARLLVLFDASASMVPWYPMAELVAESLELSRLGHAALYYFNNDPLAGLFTSPSLMRPMPLETVARLHPDCQLLVISDAGAARGRSDRSRRLGTEAFVRQAMSRGWQPVAWLNPMPRQRWNGTSAQRIARIPGLEMTELNEEGLVHAVDHLRGKSRH